METGYTGYYRLLLVRSHLLASLVSTPACTHARSILHLFHFLSPSFLFTTPSCQHLLTRPFNLPSLPLIGACSQAMVLSICILLRLFICFFPSFLAFLRVWLQQCIWSLVRASARHCVRLTYSCEGCTGIVVCCTFW